MVCGQIELIIMILFGSAVSKMYTFLPHRASLRHPREINGKQD